MMARQASKSIGGSVLAAVCALFLGLGAQAAESPYDSTSLNGNLQNQCTSFTLTRVARTSLTVSAECNKQGDTVGSVASTLNSTSMDLRSEVVWSTSDEEFTWDGTLNTEENDVSDKCDVRGSGVTVSSTDVTVNLTCAGDADLATPDPVNADLPLNGKLEASTSGELGRR